jgi:ElaB/YqjD/DUF883 family membrane-anchored ribosome-binding protein
MSTQPEQTANDSADKLQRGVQQVGDTLHATIDRVAEPVQGVVERAASAAHDTVERVAGGVQGAAERLDERLARARATPNEAVACARDYVVARPLQAVAIAFGVGWLLGRIGADR